VKRIVAAAWLGLAGCAPPPVVAADRTPPIPVATPAAAATEAEAPAVSTPMPSALPAGEPVAPPPPAEVPPVPVARTQGWCPPGGRRWPYSEGYAAFEQVKEGWPRARVTKLLGAPTSCAGAAWEYVAGHFEGPEVTYVFTFAKGVVTHIETHSVGCRSF
jgi:hypothetical protein